MSAAESSTNAGVRGRGQLRLRPSLRSAEVQRGAGVQSHPQAPGAAPLSERAPRVVLWAALSPSSSWPLVFQAGKFNIVPTIINIGSGLALMGAVSERISVTRRLGTRVPRPAAGGEDGAVGFPLPQRRFRCPGCSARGGLWPGLTHLLEAEPPRVLEHEGELSSSCRYSLTSC